MNDRTPVITHVGCADTPTTQALAKHAYEIGSSAIGIIPPYSYCDAPKSALLEHYRRVADVCPLPSHDIFNIAAEKKWFPSANLRTG